MDKIEQQKQKQKQFRIKVTTYIQGSSKNDFLNDCIRREIRETVTARNIIDIYYTLVNNFPELKENKFVEENKNKFVKIKKFLLDRINELPR